MHIHHWFSGILHYTGILKNTIVTYKLVVNIRKMQSICNRHTCFLQLNVNTMIRCTTHNSVNNEFEPLCCAAPCNSSLSWVCVAQVPNTTFGKRGRRTMMKPWHSSCITHLLDQPISWNDNAPQKPSEGRPNISGGYSYTYNYTSLGICLNEVRKNWKSFQWSLGKWLKQDKIRST